LSDHRTRLQHSCTLHHRSIQCHLRGHHLDCRRLQHKRAHGAHSHCATVELYCIPQAVLDCHRGHSVIERNTPSPGSFDYQLFKTVDLQPPATGRLLVRRHPSHLRREPNPHPSPVQLQTTAAGKLACLLPAAHKIFLAIRLAISGFGNRILPQLFWGEELRSFDCRRMFSLLLSAAAAVLASHPLRFRYPVRLC